MASVAVIAEFNPFHNGHAYLLRRIREHFGADTPVAAIMSGYFVQRGDLAVADPYIRAEMALRAGFDLVLELPFPYSASSAEYFARAGVSIASRLACFDTLAFGTECGDLGMLKEIAACIDSPAFSVRLAMLRQTEEGKRCGYAGAARDVLKELLPPALHEAVLYPNNILAVEYLRAVSVLCAPLTPFAVRRVGDRHHESTPKDARVTSASAIRSLLHTQKGNEINRYIEAEALLPLRRAILENKAPLQLNSLSGAVLARLINLSGQHDPTSAAASDGLISRILSAAYESCDLDELLSRASARSFTDAHVRRALLSVCFGVTSSETEREPSYTRVLGLRDRGRELLRIAKRKGSVAILTKTADFRALPHDARVSAERSLSADAFAQLSFPSGGRAADAYRGTPCHIGEMPHE